MRPYGPDDRVAVLALAARDRLTGQPEPTPAMLQQALRGRSPAATDGWAGLEPPRTDVAHDRSGQVLGVVSCTRRPADAAGIIGWLHAAEEPVVVAALVDSALAALGCRTVYAFPFASALAPGLPGLPVRSRPVTRKALEAAGFSARDGWRYLHRYLEGPLPAAAYPLAEVSKCAAPPGWQLHLRDTDGTLVGEATVTRAVHGVSVLGPVITDPAHLSHGLGRSLLRQCLTHLAAHGAHEVVAYLDDDTPPGHTEALYTSQGLTEIDQLRTFARRS